MAWGFHQHTEGLKKQDTDSSNPQADINDQEALSLIVAEPSVDLVSTLK